MACVQTEEDNMKRAAEVKKVEKRQLIAKMREELQNIMEDNNDQPPERRLEPEEFVIDKEYSELLHQRGRQLCEVREILRTCDIKWLY